MKETAVDTFTAMIYVGTLNRRTGAVYSSDLLAKGICREFCDQVGLCVSITNTEFIYTNGSERGFAVGLTNYPRFPDSPGGIRGKAIELAKRLMEAYRQLTVSIVMPNETVMLSADGDDAAR